MAQRPCSVALCHDLTYFWSPRKAGPKYDEMVSIIASRPKIQEGVDDSWGLGADVCDSRNILLMMNILHDVMYQNHRNSGSTIYIYILVVYIGSCRIPITNSGTNGIIQLYDRSRLVVLDFRCLWPIPDQAVSLKAVWQLRPWQRLWKEKNAAPWKSLSWPCGSGSSRPLGRGSKLGGCRTSGTDKLH